MVDLLGVVRHFLGVRVLYRYLDLDHPILLFAQGKLAGSTILAINNVRSNRRILHSFLIVRVVRLVHVADLEQRSRCYLPESGATILFEAPKHGR